MEDVFIDEYEKKILELDNRRLIYNIVNKYAGSHFREIERISKLSTGVVKYHLSYLSKNGLIIEQKDGNNIRYFPKQITAENKTLLTLLRQETIRKIILFLIIHDKSNHEQIVESIKLSPSTITWHIKKLIDNHLVKSEKKGRKTYYIIIFDKEEIMKLLITYQESFLDSLVDRVIDMWE